MQQVGKMVETEKEIVYQCLKGERKAQLHLYTILSRRVYNSCYRILGNSTDAEDAMQESFFKVFTKLESYDETVPLAAWVTRIAINISIDKLRKKNQEITEFNENINSNIIDENDDEEWENILDKVEQIKIAIDKLPESSKLIVNLFLIEGYDHEEIGEILNIKPGTSRIQYMRAKQKLKQLIKSA